MAFANHSCGRDSINARNGHRRIHNYSARHVARSIAAFGVIDGKHVAVVGSGPAGLGAAAHLVTLGAHVDIFAHPGGSRAPNGESCQQVSGWPVLISTTTAEAVKAAGLSLQVGTEHKFLGSQIVDTDSVAFCGLDGQPDLGTSSTGHQHRQAAAGEAVAWITTTQELADHIYSQCQRAHGPKVTVHRGHILTGGDPAAGKLVFEDADGEEVAVEADLVVAADGPRSLTQALLQQNDPDFTATTAQASAKTLRFSLADAGSPAAWPALETVGGAACRATLPPAVAHAPGRSQHTFRAAPGVEPSGAALTVTSAVGGTAAAVALTVDSEWWEESRTSEETLQWLEHAFPHAPRLWLEEAAAASVSARAGDAGDLRAHEFVQLSKLGSGRAVLLGHSMSACLSLGCNTALADAAALGAAVRAVDGDLAAAAAAFTAARLPEVEALQEDMRDVHAVAMYPLQATPPLPAPPVPVPMLVALLERVLALLWNLVHRAAPGLVQSKWKPWEPRGGASATVGRQGPSRGGAWATVGVVIFGCLLKVASMA